LEETKVLCAVALLVSILTIEALHATMRVSLKKEVVQQTWIVVVKDRERWPTAEVAPLT